MTRLSAGAATAGAQLAGWVGRPTVGERLEHFNNRPRGFDYIRIGLSLSVVLWHSFFLTMGNPVHQAPLFLAMRPLVAFILPAFFALSGFLVSGSLERTRSLPEFVALRVMRIVPALFVEISLSAIVLGAAFSTLPLQSYFQDPVFGQYLLNIAGDIHYHLPGVFQNNPTSRVNQSLWTIPYELLCYASIALLWIARIIRRRHLLLLTVVLFQVFLPVRDLLHGGIVIANGTLPGRALILSFLYGVLLYKYRDTVRVSRPAAAIAAALCLVFLGVPELSYFATLPAAYLTVCLGLTNPRPIPVLMSGDYSYGIYLYGAPVQQAVVALFPQYNSWWFNLLVAGPVIFAVAVFSWHVVEKPVLSRKKQLLTLVDAAVRQVERAAAGMVAGPVRPRSPTP